MTIQEKIDSIRKKIEKLEADEMELVQQLIIETNKANGINFDGELSEIDFSDFELNPAFSILENLCDFCKKNIRDIYSFNSWDEVPDDTLYFMYDGKIYELMITEDYCIESSHDGRIMSWDVTVSLVC